MSGPISNFVKGKFGAYLSSFSNDELLEYFPDLFEQHGEKAREIFLTKAQAKFADFLGSVATKPLELALQNTRDAALEGEPLQEPEEFASKLVDNLIKNGIKDEFLEWAKSSLR